MERVGTGGKDCRPQIKGRLPLPRTQSLGRSPSLGVPESRSCRGRASGRQLQTQRACRDQQGPGGRQRREQAGAGARPGLPCPQAVPVLRFPRGLRGFPSHPTHPGTCSSSGQQPPATKALQAQSSSRRLLPRGHMAPRGHCEPHPPGRGDGLDLPGRQWSRPRTLS